MERLYPATGDDDDRGLGVWWGSLLARALRLAELRSIVVNAMYYGASRQQIAREAGVSINVLRTLLAGSEPRQPDDVSKLTRWAAGRAPKVSEEAAALDALCWWGGSVVKRKTLRQRLAVAVLDAYASTEDVLPSEFHQHLLGVARGEA